MTESIDDKLRNLDGPRALPPGVQARLEARLTGVSGPLAGIGAPRDLPPHLRHRLEQAITHRVSRRGYVLTTTVAACIALLITANTVVLLSSRREPAPVAAPPPPSPSPTASIPDPPKPPPPSALRGFDSPQDFLNYVRTEALKLVTPYGIRNLGSNRGLMFGDAVFVQTDGRAAESAASPDMPAASSAITASEPFSSTNIQEAGVDEPDLVKTDGRRLAVLVPTGISLLDVTRATPRVEGSIEIGEGQGVGLLLVGDRLVLLTSSYETYVHGSSQAVRDPSSQFSLPTRPWTKVTVIDIARPSRPEIVSSMKVEGSYVAARESAGVVRLVTESGALGPEPASIELRSADQAAALAANKRSLRSSVVGHWLPHYVLEEPGKKPVTGHVHEWDRISKPAEPAGVSMLTVMTIDPANPAPDNAVSVVGAGENIYASTTILYVTTNKLDDILALEQGQQTEGSATAIHMFDIADPWSARYVASGVVPGFVLNQFSMSEYDGKLRIATTVGNPWVPTATNESFVTVLEKQGLELVPVGSVGNLGKGERIYSVRFIGPMGYVVTFRKTDPLYVVDLHNPLQPEVKGELKIPGFSAYLHPIGETMLLGVGQLANESDGLVQGLQFSLFDVSDPSNPRRVHERVVGQRGSHSETQEDHHAFLYWAPTGLLAVPATVIEEGQQPFSGGLLMTVSAEDGFAEPTRVTHTGRIQDSYSSIRRILVIGERVLTISSDGILVNDLKTFAERAWVPLPR